MSRGSFRAVHPGTILREELEARRLPARMLARRMRVPVMQVTEIIDGRRPISDALARKLGTALGTGARIWRSMQRAYDKEQQPN